MVNSYSTLGGQVAVSAAASQVSKRGEGEGEKRRAAGGGGGPKSPKSA